MVFTPGRILRVKSYTLNDLKYRGCQGCMACKTKLEKRVLKDDLAEVLDQKAA